MILPILLFLASATLGAPTALSQSEQFVRLENPETLGVYVREYFSDTPILADIAWCESRMRHFGEDGKIFRGKANPNDVGVMQINTGFHSEDAKELGIDLYSLSGNLAYAKHLYEKEGTKPWRASKPCWGEK